MGRSRPWIGRRGKAADQTLHGPSMYEEAVSSSNFPLSGQHEDRVRPPGTEWSETSRLCCGGAGRQYATFRNGLAEQFSVGCTLVSTRACRCHLPLPCADHSSDDTAAAGDALRREDSGTTYALGTKQCTNQCMYVGSFRSCNEASTTSGSTLTCELASGPFEKETGFSRASRFAGHCASGSGAKGSKRSRRNHQRRNEGTGIPFLNVGLAK